MSFEIRTVILISLLIGTMLFPMIIIPIIGIGIILWVLHLIFSTISKKIRNKKITNS
jgi:hypothetical protein